MQKVFAAKMLVAFSMVGVDTRRLDIHLDPGRGGTLLVVAEGSGEDIETAIQPAVAKVLDTELDEGFDRLFDKVTVCFFAKNLGTDPAQLIMNRVRGSSSTCLSRGRV